jgi:1,4-alpha-glucan branching enzyme
MTAALGYVCLTLHSHLPFVRHPEHEDFLEEDWLFEAITETYIPLLRAFERLDADRVPYRITVGVTPPLAAMLGDPLLQSRYRRHLGKQRELIAREVRGNPAETPVGKLARFYRAFLQETNDAFEQRWGGNLLEGFRAAQGRGSVELVTSTATHAFLPLLSSERCRRAQVRVGCEAFRRAFGRQPRGIWLAECAYARGVDCLLAEQGVEYFFLDGHGILYGEPRPAYGVFAPVATPGGVYAFARDTDSARQVWSSKEGYPGDPWYREFYRDLGYDADYAYLRPYLHADGIRRGVGIKYHRVTGDVALDRKAYYDPARAFERAGVHAAHFAASRLEQASALRARMDRPPVMVAPYDSELFGHWWFEGPLFLESLCRRLATEVPELRTVTPHDYLALHPSVQRQEPCPSTWGAEGYNKVWLNGANAGIYRHLHHAERRMERLVDRFPAAVGARKRALDQAARELLLAQSSDWAFIVTSATAVPYAVRRVREHLARFERLANAAESDSASAETIEEILAAERASGCEPIFPWLDYRVFAAPAQ